MRHEEFEFASPVRQAAKAWLIHAIKYKTYGNQFHARAMLQLQPRLPKKVLDALAKQVEAM